MTEFWEMSFVEKQAMWGLEPAESAIIAKDIFIEKAKTRILIPGIGYGRNAKVFTDNGMKVTGIEISNTAIGLARKYYGNDMDIYHGSVTDMPFDENKFEGVFCYALIHLLNSRERMKLIQDCYNQLEINGSMIFVAVSKKSPNYQMGKPLSKDRFEIMKGVKMFFYDEDSVIKEFGKFGLIKYKEIDEKKRNMHNKPALTFWFIECIKK